MPLTINVIRGNIGAGKSAILHAVQACTQYETDVHILVEDTKEWQYYLKKFYNDPAQYAFLFQKDVEMHFFRMTKLLEQLAETGVDGRHVVVYVERAPSDVIGVFLPLNKHHMTDSQYQCLMQSMVEFGSRSVWTQANYFNIECPVDECLKRIATRRRDGEENITAEYLTRIHSLYQKLNSESGGRSLQNYGLRHSLLQSVRIVTECCYRQTTGEH